MGKLKILIADDESIIRLGLKTILSDLGYEVTMATDGREALRLAHQKEFDVAIFDIKMPFTDGLDAARALYKFRPTPILLLTAFGEQELIEKASDLPIQGYLLKPVDETQLSAAITVALKRFKETKSLVNKTSELEERLETRKLIEQAKGILMKQGLSEDEAHKHLQRLARDSQTSLRKVAEELLRPSMSSGEPK
jgi:response regulator NasT